VPVRILRHARGIGVGVLLVALAVVVLISPSRGRASPLGVYRPPLQAGALESGCYPLPAGVALDFPHQVRLDGDVSTGAGPRRRLEVQYDVLDAAAVSARLRRTLLAAGYAEQPAAGDELRFRGPAGVAVGATVTPLAGVPDDAIVRGTVVLDLPTLGAQRDDRACADPAVTKRVPRG
jgi:hypothetical protein